MWLLLCTLCYVQSLIKFYVIWPTRIFTLYFMGGGCFNTQGPDFQKILGQT